MFCDLAGYTALANELDMEEVAQIVATYQATCAEPIARFGGTVAQYLGDGVLVYFGYPQAHEDDAIRAAHAALAMLEALPAALASVTPRGSVVPKVRIGIHTGLVVVDRVGAGADFELLAMGETVNLAARLESGAPEGGALISEATRGLLADSFEVEAQGGVAFKGYAQPVEVYRLGTARTLAGRAAARTQKVSPLIGRVAEHARLVEAFGLAVSGDGSVVWIQAEAGLGKSRLLSALRESLVETAHGWRECGCSTFQTNSAFHPFTALLYNELKLDHEPLDEVDFERLVDTLGDEVSALGVASVATLLGAEEDEIASHGLPDPRTHSGEAVREHAIQALTSWLLRTNSRTASVLIIEDLHWADPSSLELIERLVAGVSGSQLLLLMTARPDFEPGWPEPEASRIELQPLEEKEVEALIRSVAADGLEVEQLVAVARQSDGIPLFAEELTKNALESENDEIPPSLQDSLMARLDRLGPAREIAQLAATIGRDFSVNVLKAIWTGDRGRLPELIARLTEADLLAPQFGVSDERFVFRHALFQEVAYGSLLRRQRRELHGQIARLAEEEFAGTALAESQSLARHYEAAGEIELAVHHLSRAGSRANQRSALKESIAYLERALELLKDLEASPERDELELEVRMAIGAPLQATLGYTNPEVIQTYERAHALSHASQSQARIGDIQWGLFSFNLVRGSFVTAAELAGALQLQAEMTGDSGLMIAAHHAAGSIHYFDGRYAEALREFESVVERYEPEKHAKLAHSRGQDHAVGSQVTAGMAAWMLGRPRTANAHAQEAVERARRIGHPLTLGFALGYAAAVSAVRRQPAEVVALCEELIAYAKEQSLPVWGGLGKMLMGWALCGTDEDAKGVKAINQGLGQSAGTGAAFEAPFFSTLIADAHLRGGRPDDAARGVDFGRVLASRHESPYAGAELARMHGECLLANLDADPDAMRIEAEEAFLLALRIARAQAIPGPELRARMSAARLMISSERLADASKMLEGAEDLWTEEDPDNPDLTDLAGLRNQLATAG
jgi:class 3 adenylate cyclase/tetratricopeptide (TPR) repeat protein